MKKTEKKLVLNRETVRVLTARNLDRVAGGHWPPIKLPDTFFCPTVTDTLECPPR